jgi:glycosyltransferase involved in cell wall biosynthesis
VSHPVPPRPPAISFAIPYYDNRAYLAEAIASIRAQTVEDWELVVVDDCGPEPAGDLVAALGDPRVTYVRNQTNLGLSGNWNECVRLARGPWVTLLHGDDRLLPRYAERVLAAAGGRPAPAAVFTDAVTIGPTGEPTTTAADLAKRFFPRPRHDHDLQGDEATAVLLAGNYILCPTLCLDRERLGTAPFDTRWRFVPDWAFTVGLLLEGETLHSVRQPLLEYRRHATSQTSKQTVDASRFTEEIAFLDEMAELAGRNGWSASERAARRRVSVRGHLVQKALVDVLRGRGAAARAKGRILHRDLRGRAHHPDA